MVFYHQFVKFSNVKKENIMKKRLALVLIVCLLIALSMTTFVACNDKEDDTITIKVYSVPNTHTENPTLKNTITIKKDSAFSINEYYEKYAERDTADGGVIGWGFYLDSTCRQKHNDDNVLEEDTSFYLLYCSFGSKFVQFKYEGKEYSYYVEDTTEKLAADTFAISEYGKTMDSSKLQYFADEAMTQPIEIAGKSFDEIEVEAVGSIPYCEKYVYVKYSE